MKFSSYMKDKIVELLVFSITYIFMLFLLYSFNCNFLIIGTFIIFYLLLFLVFFIYDYKKRDKFYTFINNKLYELDKKYLISELINNDDFIDASMLKDYLYEIDKSFIEELNKYKFTNEEFKDYIELWCHEIKTPIATSKLIIDNNKNKVTNNIYEEIDKIESFVEQVLFYSRSENVEKDYIISKTNLKEVINEVIIKNKKDIIGKSIKISSIKEDIYVNSDSKWLKYIIEQVIINSIKYSKSNNAKITISVNENKNNIVLSIEDNGIGIDVSEINRVFDKGFTGSNGRKSYKSTGIGLYLCKKLCNRLDHDIIIESVLNKKTIVSIIFPINSMTNNIKE